MSLLRWLLVMLLLAACNTAAGEAVPEDSWVADAAAMPSDRIVRALALLGTPYRKRGVSPESGFDCSGFVGWVFRQTGVDLPRTAQQMYHAIEEKVERAAVQPGDLLFFRIGRQGRAINHVAIAIGDGRFVHSPATGGVVRIESLDIPYWSKRFVGARRAAEPVPAAAGPPPGGIQETVSLPAETAETGAATAPPAPPALPGTGFQEKTTCC